MVWSRERERKKGKERGGTSPAPDGERSLGCGTTCASGSSWESKEHSKITNLWAPGSGEGQKPHLPARISSQPSPATHFPSAFPWPCLNSLLSPRLCVLACTGKPSCHKSPVRISLTQGRLCSPNCLQPPVVHWN